MTSIWVGQRVRLRGIEPADWADFRSFDEDTEVQRNADMVHPPRSAAAALQWAEESSTRQPENDQFQLAIESLDDGVLVGALSTNSTDQRVGRFSYGLGIGRKHQRRGYGSDAATLLLRFMFGASLPQGRGRHLLLQRRVHRSARAPGIPAGGPVAGPRVPRRPLLRPGDDGDDDRRVRRPPSLSGALTPAALPPRRSDTRALTPRRG